MGISKEHFIEATGGFRFDETPEEFRARVKEILAIERLIKSCKLRGADLERAQRKLCALKGIDFDSKDDGE